MICEKHNTEPQLICGELVCGSCSGEQWEKEPLPKNPNPQTIDMSKGMFGRNEHYRRPPENSD